jgi:thiazole synthase ThiGH ThiG subunit
MDVGGFGVPFLIVEAGLGRAGGAVKRGRAMLWGISAAYSVTAVASMLCPKGNAENER